MRDHLHALTANALDLLFNKIKCKIQQHGNDAEDHNGHQTHVSLNVWLPK